jgi:hypothetical protein
LRDVERGVGRRNAKEMEKLRKMEGGDCLRGEGRRDPLLPVLSRKLFDEARRILECREEDVCADSDCLLQITPVVREGVGGDRGGGGERGEERGRRERRR